MSMLPSSLPGAYNGGCNCGTILFLVALIVIVLAAGCGKTSFAPLPCVDGVTGSSLIQATPAYPSPLTQNHYAYQIGYNLPYTIV